MSEAPRDPHDPTAGEDRRWTWMDRWDPATWQMPANPSRLTRVLAALALVIVLVMTFYVPFRMLGVFG